MVRDDQDDTAAYAIAIVLVIVLLGAVGMVAVVKYVLPLVEGGDIVRSGVGSCCVYQLHRTHRCPTLGRLCGEASKPGLPAFKPLPNGSLAGTSGAQSR